MKKNLILSVFLIGALIFVGNVMAEDLPESGLENNAIEMEPQFEINVPDGDHFIPEEIDPALEPEGDPDSDILFKEEIAPDMELEGEDRIVLEPGNSIE